MLGITLSDEAKNKVKAFKKRKRAYYSCWILALAFAFSLIAELYANTRPIFVLYEGKTYFPILKEYSETEFGGFLDTEADYSDSFIREEFAKPGNYALYPFIRWDYKTINYNSALKHPSPPSRENFLGTDNRGRDVLSRLIYGFRISLIFGLLLAALDALIGVAVGAFEGFFGGKTDLLCQRFIEILSSIPQLYVLILIASLFTPSIPLLIFILALFGWIPNQSLVRVEFLKSRNHDYVKAARALGVSDVVIMARHILPNALTMVITRLPFSITAAMTGLVSLDFLGLGVPSPTPSFGESLRQGLANMSEAWWIGLSTVSVLIFILILVAFIGEAILDVFDPKRT